MLAFLRLFLKFVWQIRHTDEMRSILEVGSEQLHHMNILLSEHFHPMKGRTSKKTDEKETGE